MKSLLVHTAVFLLGVLFAFAISASAKNIADFQIQLTSQGKVELHCADGCAWEKLTWTCDEDDPGQECTVKVDEFGMGGTD